MKKYIYVSIAACAVFVLSFQSCKKTAISSPVKSESFALTDVSNKSINYLDPELLQKIYADLITSGRNEDASQLYSQYDIETGFLKSLGKKEALVSTFRNIPIDSSKIVHVDTVSTLKAIPWHMNSVYADGWVEGIGLQSGILQVSDSSSTIISTFVGTTGQSLRLEGFRLRCDSTILDIRYAIMYPDGTWGGGFSTPMWDYWVGTQGQSQATSGIRIWFANSNQGDFHAYYRTHMAGVGWGSWSGDGAVSGIQGVRLEAFAYQIIKY
jgi:hypothetical protein